MSILEKLPDDPQREIELLRELVKTKDALIAELSKRPIASPPIYVPYPSYPTWPTYPWKYSSDQWTVTTATTTGVTIDGNGNVKHYVNGVEVKQ